MSANGRQARVAPLVRPAGARPADGFADADAVRAWLRLLACANVVEGEIRRRLRARFAVTLPRFDLLAQLAKAPDGLALGELSRRMMVSAGNVTGLVERLVEDGLIVREVAPHDKRSATVRLTEAGRATFDEMAAEHARWLGEIFAGLDAADIDALGALVGRLKASAQAAADRREDGPDGKATRP